MADFGLIGGGADAIQAGYTTSTNLGTAITSNSSTHTVGAYVDIVTAGNNTFTSDSIDVYISTGTTGATQTPYLINIAIGGAGSEEDIIPNLYVFPSASTAIATVFKYSFPISIPSGVRISANCQSGSSNAAINVHIVRRKAGFGASSALSKVTSFGADTATSSGTIVARAGIGVFGSWVTIDTAIANSIRGFVSVGVRGVASWTNGSLLAYEVGVGVSPISICSGHNMAMSSTESVINPVSPFLGVGVANGERLSIRAVANVAGTDLDLDYVIYGVS